MIKYDKIGRCDACMKESTRVFVTLNKSMMQGQICTKCFKKLF